MKVRVLYFAAVRELVERDEEWLEVESGATVSGLAALLEARHARLAGLLGRVRFAVDEVFADREATLPDGATVAIIPPVAGGSGRVQITEAPLSIDAVCAHVRDRRAGALAIFVGVVRDHHEGRAVAELEYSAYRSMAQAEIERIVAELEAERPEVRLAVAHRVGPLVVGDDAIVCAASSPHRAEAFEAGRALIDRVKERAPIWKRERGPDGARWIGWDVSDAP